MTLQMLTVHANHKIKAVSADMEFRMTQLNKKSTLDQCGTGEA